MKSTHQLISFRRNWTIIKVLLWIQLYLLKVLFIYVHFAHLKLG